LHHGSNFVSDVSTETEVSERRISDHSPKILALMALVQPLRLAKILGWRILGKRKRARTQLERAIDALPFADSRWNAAAARKDAALVRSAREDVRIPRIAVHLHIGPIHAKRHVDDTIRSILGQADECAGVFVTRERGCSLEILAHDALTQLAGVFDSRLDALNACLEEGQKYGAQWLVPLEPETRPAQHALTSYSAHLLRHAEARRAAVIYGDEIAPGPLWARPRMWLKSEWDSRMILSQDYVSAACALAVEPAARLLQLDKSERPQNLFELTLRLGLENGAHHVSRVTAQTRPQVWRNNGTETLAAVTRTMKEGVETVEAGPFGTVSLQYEMPHPLPKVSVIVATRDRVELLRTCVEGVLHETDYANLELVIADNDSIEAETLRYMDAVAADPRVKVVRWPYPFNYSAINNFAVRHSSGAYICLLNNDIEVLESHWLMAMMREAVQPGVGAVGARLLYPDRTIQHAGVAIGIGNAAGHAHRGLPEDQAGYFAQAHIARGASAVTAACLVVAKQHFDAVDGLDEDFLAVAYNDVDLCLKLGAMGLRNIYTPEATLIHHESKSRGLDFAPEHLERYMRELEAFQTRWQTTKCIDPWHHLRLDRGSEVFAT